jgi:hypothetical protein
MKTAYVTTLAALLAIVSSPCASAAERTSTLGDQRAVNVTIYSDGNALLHDRRSIVLGNGINQVAWRDVSASMDPTSALLDGSETGVSAIEQNFNYDVLNSTSLLQSYLGKTVTVVHPPRFAGQLPVREEAKILGLDNGIVLQYADRVETQVDGTIVFPGVPSSLRDRPTLTLELRSPRAGRSDLDLSYLTSGLSWSVDYVGTLSSDQTTMNLAGLVTLKNESGTSFKSARLQLIAGSVHTAPPRQLVTIARVVAQTVDTYTMNAQQEPLFEYHLYTIGHPTDILDKQTKQVLLLSARDIPMKKTLELRGSTYYFQGAAGDIGDRLPVGVYVAFDNRGGNLGIPLPAGRVRMYQSDSHGLAQFLGSDSIGHTPRNDTVRLYLGDAFDVVARKKQTDFHLKTNCRATSAYEITLINGKDAAQNVLVVEPLPGDWTISNESQPHEKSSARTASWNVVVPADGKATLTYTADVTWCRS